MNRPQFSPANKCFVIGTGSFFCLTGKVDPRKSRGILPSAVYCFQTLQERTDWLAGRHREDPKFEVTILGPWQQTEEAVLPRFAEER
jgi:hypothetical protein